MVSDFEIATQRVIDTIQYQTPNDDIHDQLHKKWDELKAHIYVVLTNNSGNGKNVLYARYSNIRKQYSKVLNLFRGFQKEKEDQRITKGEKFDMICLRFDYTLSVLHVFDDVIPHLLTDLLDYYPEKVIQKPYEFEEFILAFFNFNNDGYKKFFELTKRNYPEGPKIRLKRWEYSEIDPVLIRAMKREYSDRPMGQEVKLSHFNKNYFITNLDMAHFFNHKPILNMEGRVVPINQINELQRNYFLGYDRAQESFDQIVNEKIGIAEKSDANKIKALMILIPEWKSKQFSFVTSTKTFREAGEVDGYLYKAWKQAKFFPELTHLFVSDKNPKISKLEYQLQEDTINPLVKKMYLENIAWLDEKVSFYDDGVMKEKFYSRELDRTQRVIKTHMGPEVDTTIRQNAVYLKSAILFEKELVRRIRALKKERTDEKAVRTLGIARSNNTIQFEVEDRQKVDKTIISASTVARTIDAPVFLFGKVSQDLMTRIFDLDEMMYSDLPINMNIGAYKDMTQNIFEATPLKYRSQLFEYLLNQATNYKNKKKADEKYDQGRYIEKKTIVKGIHHELSRFVETDQDKVCLKVYVLEDYIKWLESEQLNKLMLIEGIQTKLSVNKSQKQKTNRNQESLWDESIKQKVVSFTNKVKTWNGAIPKNQGKDFIVILVALMEGGELAHTKSGTQIRKEFDGLLEGLPKRETIERHIRDVKKPIKGSNSWESDKEDFLKQFKEFKP